MNTLNLRIPMRIVAKKNRLTPIPIYLRKGAGAWSYLGKKARVGLVPDGTYKKFEREAQKHILPQLPAGFKPIDYYFKLYAEFYWWRWEPDTSGCLESIGDALEGVVWADDKYICDERGKKFQVKKEADAEIRLEVSLL